MVAGSMSRPLDRGQLPADLLKSRLASLSHPITIAFDACRTFRPAFRRQFGLQDHDLIDLPNKEQLGQTAELAEALGAIEVLHGWRYSRYRLS